jgi:diguanylate cyclase (GGDEF)-like protein
MPAERTSLRSRIEAAWRHVAEAVASLGHLAAAKLPGGFTTAWQLGREKLDRLRLGVQPILQRALPVLSKGLRALTDFSRHVMSRLPTDIRLDSIKSKIIVFALLATLIPTVITAVIAYTNSSRAITDKITEQLQRASASAAREMDLWFKERIYDVRVFASSYEVTENLEAIYPLVAETPAAMDAQTRLSDYLDAVQERFTDYDELLVLDPTERIVATSAQRAAPEVSLPPDWPKVLQAGSPVIGNVLWDERGERTLLPIGVPLRGASGRLLGALVATLNFEAVDEILTRFSPGEAGNLYLITAAGSPAVGSQSQSLPSMALEISAARDVFAAEGTIVEYADSRGDDVVGTLRRVPPLGWAVVAEIPRRQAYAPAARLRNATVFLVFALLFGVGFIAYRLGLLIVRPLDRLTAGVAEVAGGDLAVDLPVMGGGEVGYLTAVFNDMVRRLREGREKLDAINEKLSLKNEELERISITDGLTGLSNRRHLMELLEHEARRTQRTKHPFSVLVVDVDHFKKFNDTYGHLAGDQVLTKLATVLQHTIREIDSAARYGGEEFVLLLPETDLAGAVQAGERIRARLAREKFAVGDDEATVTVSMGAAEFPIDGDTTEAVIASADAALYQAKRRGRNRVARARRRRKASTAKRQS